MLNLFYSIDSHKSVVVKEFGRQMTHEKGFEGELYDENNFQSDEEDMMEFGWTRDATTQTMVMTCSFEIGNGVEAFLRIYRCYRVPPFCRWHSQQAFVFVSLTGPIAIQSFTKIVKMKRDPSQNQRFDGLCNVSVSEKRRFDARSSQQSDFKS